jgi:hypothetical protein
LSRQEQSGKHLLAMSISHFDPTETSSANSNSGASHAPAAHDTSLSAIVDPSALRAMTIQPNLIAL